ncbi:MAG: hypothetical protein P8P45_06205 [Flavobacteriales bacterium]|nr:hypothetical protein [Flavobacteriales bacterium]
MTCRLWIFGLLLLSACGPRPGAEHLNALQRQLTVIDSAAAVFNAAPHDAAIQAHLIADSALAAVETRMQGLVVNLEQGKPFSDLDERRRLLKKQPGRQRRIAQEIDRTRRQIGNLIEAIVDGAKVDALGAPMDQTYFDEATADEMRISTHLLEEMNIALDFLQRGLSNLDDLVSKADSTSAALSALPKTESP